MAVFEASVIAIGIIGGIANLLMLIAFAQSKARKYDMAIVFSQMILDLLCCIQLVISYTLKVLVIDYSSAIGRALCRSIGSELMLWYFLGCSTDNLIVLTLERYVKIVHAVFHKKYFRRWMYPVVIALTWINFEVVFSITIGSLGSVIVDGQCINYAVVPPAINATAFTVYKFLNNFILPPVTFVFCYTRMLKVTNRRIVPVNFNNMMKSAAEQKAMKIQMSIIKTFLIISICFVLCWLPNGLYFFLSNLRIAKNLSSNVRYITVFLAFLNVCLNPVIYAANLDPVKKYLREKLCRRQNQENGESVVTVINIIGNSKAV